MDDARIRRGSLLYTIYGTCSLQVFKHEIEVYINRTNRPYSYRADGPDGTVTGPYLCTVWVTHRALPSTLATSLPTPPPLVNGRDEVNVLRRAGHTGGKGSCGAVTMLLPTSSW